MAQGNHFGAKMFGFVNGTILGMFGIACVYPFIYIGALSLNDAKDSARGGVYWFPREFTWDNYIAIFSNNDIGLALGISAARVVSVIALVLLFNTMFAYALSTKAFRARHALNWLIVIPMYFTGGLIPTYIVLHYTHLLNTFLVYIIPGLFVSYFILLLVASIRDVPEALMESAKLDGANDPVILFRLVVPLIKPVLAAIALFAGVGAWNDWYMGAVYITNDQLWTLQNVLLYILKSNESSNLANQLIRLRRNSNVTVESVKMAMLFVATVPVLVIYPLLQRHFVKGIMIGSLKG